uniref:Uncharacterized protein n=1 Tax=Candidatus Kentrum sp. FM TaxID=2126340 RepID=A0A450W7D2_9GAMM|nr:MAG: hypothetical protein BECKFM1743A_GA0114220_102725 [Candidatus Kentron sp. FM]VFK12898.1 MAG: hypothetical protein BECKFM1743B_GA0114221_102605 [Candidatus Kentron sp. FM]
MSLRKKLLDTFGAQVSSDHERYPADVKCLSLLYLYVGRYPRNNASRNTQTLPIPRGHVVSRIQWKVISGGRKRKPNCA